LTSHPANDSVLELVRGWIRHCKANHTGSQNVSARPGVRPRRLLDLRKAAFGFIEVVEVDASVNHEYVTLSYCWGEDRSRYKPWSDYVAEIQRDNGLVEVRRMPRTLKDAVVYSVKLQYNFL